MKTTVVYILKSYSLYCKNIDDWDYIMVYIYSVYAAPQTVLMTFSIAPWT